MLQGMGSRGAQPELRDATWPRWLAQAGIAVGIAVLSGFVLRENWMAFKLVFVLGCIRLALAGTTIGAHEACANPPPSPRAGAHLPAPPAHAQRRHGARGAVPLQVALRHSRWSLTLTLWALQLLRVLRREPPG